MFFNLQLESQKKTEFIDITHHVNSLVQDSGVQDGACIIFVVHTTAGVTINENADPAVAGDMINYFDKLVPWSNSYQHLEGNSASHIKASLMGASQHLIINKGRLVLGTWQGLYFTEFDGPRKRTVVVKII